MGVRKQIDHFADIGQRLFQRACIGQEQPAALIALIGPHIVRRRTPRSTRHRSNLSFDLLPTAIGFTGATMVFRANPVAGSEERHGRTQALSLCPQCNGIAVSGARGIEMMECRYKEPS